MRPLSIALLLSAAAFAQVEEKGRIEGRVVSTAGEPIGKATVRIYPNAGRDAVAATYIERTTADGTFAAAGLPPGAYVVEALRDGYQGGRPASVTIAAGRTERIDVQLRAMLTVSGKVIDQDANPVPNAIVSLRAPQLAHLSLNGQATTNDFGEFRLANVAPGNYLVVVMPPRDLTQSPALEIRGPSAQQQIQPTYYPGVVNPADATVLRVGSSIAGLDVRVLQGSRYTVRVTVAPFDASTRVMLKSRRTDDDRSGTSWGTSAGTVAIPSVVPGEYTVVATSGSRIRGSVAVTVTDANVDVTVPRAEPGTLKGRIRVEGVADFESFVAGALSARREAPRPLQVYLLSTPEYSGFLSNVLIQVAKDGSFEVPNVLPMQYSLNHPLPQSSTFVKSVVLNGRPIPGDRLDLSQGGGGTLEIVLSPRPATIELTPPEGWPPPSTPPNENQQRWFTVWSTRPMPGRPSGYFASAAASIGRESTPIEALPPGDYFAVAWEELPPSNIVSEPAFLARFAQFAARVAVEEGGRASVRAKLIPRQELRRLIVDAPVP